MVTDLAGLCRYAEKLLRPAKHMNQKRKYETSVK